MIFNTNYLIAAVVYLVLCVLVGFLGRNRKWGYYGYLFSSILFTPVLGLLFVLAADPPPRRGRSVE